MSARALHGFAWGLVAMLLAVAAPLSAEVLPVGGCVGVDLPSGSPVGLVRTCDDLRPGARIEVLDRAGCTAAFLFRGSDDNIYASTAGHCAIVPLPREEEREEMTWEYGRGLHVSSPGMGRIGEFVYARMARDGVKALDFGLIRLDEGVPYDPQMMHWGGPTGSYEDYPPYGSELMVLRVYGQGIGFGDSVPARSEIALGAPDPQWMPRWGLRNSGDSGMPIITQDGRAVGVHVTAGAGVTFEGDAGNVFATRLPAAIARAESILGLTFELLTAPLID